MHSVIIILIINLSLTIKSKSLNSHQDLEAKIFPFLASGQKRNWPIDESLYFIIFNFSKDFVK